MPSTTEPTPGRGTTEVPPDVERDFRASIDGALPWRVRIAALTCLGGSGAFALLDALALGGGLLNFRVAVRAAFSPAYLLLWWLASPAPRRAPPHLPVLALAGVLAAEMGILGARMAPAESVGFFPAMLFFTVFLPLPRRRAAVMAALFVLGFLLPQLLIEPGPLGPIIKHTGNLLAAGLIGLVASHMSDTLARREFVAQRRLSDTGARLEALARTKDRFFTEVSTELRTPPTAPLVLVVEDHLELASRLQASIGPSARVHLVPDAETALAQLRELRPDLVISESLLPGGHLSGLELARRIRELPGTTTTPILLLSALTEREHVLSALRAGADDVLGKPFDGAMLRARVESLLLLKKKRDEARESRALLRALCNGFARALGWESVVLLVPAEHGALSPLAWGGLEPAEGHWGDQRSAWVNGPPRALVSDGREQEPLAPALGGRGAVAMAPLESHEQQGVLVGMSTSPHAVEARQLDGLKAAAASVGALLDRERRADALEQLAEDRRRLSTAVVNGQDAERRRLALELHDGAGQVLVGVLLQLDLGLKGNLGQEPLRAARALAQQALAEIRAFSHDLHPPLLAQHGLKQTLRELARQMTSERPAVTAEIGQTVPDALPPVLSLNLFRIAQAALANAVRHANARNIVLRLSLRAGEAVLEIEDDGEGFLPDLARRGVGLLGMRERAQSLGGELELTSDLGRGSLVRCRVPVRGTGEPGPA